MAAAVVPDLPWENYHDVVTPRWRTDTAPLYRGDRRSPEDVFRLGFAPQNPENMSLRAHTGTKTESAYVSTTRDPKVAANRSLNCGQDPSQSDGHVYIVDAPGGIDMVKTRGFSDPYNAREVSFPGGVRPEFIRGAGKMDPTTGNFVDFIPNPNYLPRETP